jgi:hypothetical protein
MFCSLKTTTSTLCYAGYFEGTLTLLDLSDFREFFPPPKTLFSMNL